MQRKRKVRGSSNAIQKNEDINLQVHTCNFDLFITEISKYTYSLSSDVYCGWWVAQGTKKWSCSKFSALKLTAGGHMPLNLLIILRICMKTIYEPLLNDIC